MNDRKCQTEPAATDTAPAADNPVRVPKQLRTRLKRVQDYQSQALAKTDALEANLGSVNSGLMGISLQLDHAIRKALEEGPLTIPELAEKLNIDKGEATYYLMSLRKYGVVTAGEQDDMDEFFYYQLKK